MIANVQKSRNLPYSLRMAVDVGKVTVLAILLIVAIFKLYGLFTPTLLVLLYRSVIKLIRDWSAIAAS